MWISFTPTTWGGFYEVYLGNIYKLPSNPKLKDKMSSNITCLKMRPFVSLNYNFKFLYMKESIKLMSSDYLYILSSLEPNK